MRHRSFRKRLLNTGERKSIFCNNVSRDEEEESHAMGVAKMHVSARREPIAFWGNSRISPLCHFWRLSTVTRTKIRSAIFARNVVDSNETSRPLPAIRSARSFLFPKSNENRPFSNSEVCSGLLLLRGMIFVSHFSSSSSSSSSSFWMSLDNFRHFKTRDLFEEEQPPRRKEK